MASLPTNYTLHLHHCLSTPSPRLCHLRKLSRRFPASVSGKVEVFAFRENLKGREKVYSFCCSCKAGTQLDKVSGEEEIERPPFDINLAVILAGFAFEAYTSPPVNVFESNFSYSFLGLGF